MKRKDNEEIKLGQSEFLSSKRVEETQEGFMVENKEWWLANNLQRHS